jgi:hypothetical protein
MRVVLNFGTELRMDDFEIGTCHHLTLSNPMVTVQHLFCRQDIPYFTHKMCLYVPYTSGDERLLFSCRTLIGWWW